MPCLTWAALAVTEKAKLVRFFVTAMARSCERSFEFPFKPMRRNWQQRPGQKLDCGSFPSRIKHRPVEVRLNCSLLNSGHRGKLIRGTPISVDAQTCSCENGSCLDGTNLARIVNRRVIFSFMLHRTPFQRGQTALLGCHCGVRFLLVVCFAQAPASTRFGHSHF